MLNIKNCRRKRRLLFAIFQHRESSESSFFGRMDKIKETICVIDGKGILSDKHLRALAAAAWWLLRPPGLPAGFASSNGRIEATEVDIASKIAGRIDTILVKEGIFYSSCTSGR